MALNTSSNIKMPHSLRFSTRFRTTPNNCCYHRQLWKPKVWRQGCKLQHSLVQPRSMDEGSMDISSFDDWGYNEGASDYMVFSSDGEDSDGEILLTPMNDVDMPTIKKNFITAEDALTATASRLALLGRMHKKDRITYGFVCNLGLITFLISCIAFLDWSAWRIVRKPFDSFYFFSPFLTSSFLAACTGYISIPILKRLNIRQKFRRKWPYMYYSEKGTPTLGGAFFIPIGVVIAKVMGGSTPEFSGIFLVTLAYAFVGFLDDLICLIKSRSYGLSQGPKLLLQVAIAVWFSYWLYTNDISSPYGIKMVVPLPAPFGLVNVGEYYLLLVVLTFIVMVNGKNLIDGLDGFGGGTSALAFFAMSVAVLPICSDVSVFGTSMAGACVGFLLHNRYKASVMMGSTGSFALGGALAAMASCSGMFLPLFIASGILVIEMFAVLIQMFVFRITESLKGKSHNLYHASPLHQYLEACGMREPYIVTGAYVISSFLALLAGFVGLTSA